jgi:hypothetical protein
MLQLTVNTKVCAEPCVDMDKPKAQKGVRG